jgi:hypothetical protein
MTLALSAEKSSARLLPLDAEAPALVETATFALG